MEKEKPGWSGRQEQSEIEELGETRLAHVHTKAQEEDSNKYKDGKQIYQEKDRFLKCNAKTGKKDLYRLSGILAAHQTHLTESLKCQLKKD